MGHAVCGFIYRALQTVHCTVHTEDANLKPAVAKLHVLTTTHGEDWNDLLCAAFVDISKPRSVPSDVKLMHPRYAL